MYNKLSQRKPAEHKKTSRDKSSKQNLIGLSLKTHLEEKRRDVLVSEKGLQLIKLVSLPVINPFYCYGAICSRPRFCVQQKQEFEYSGSYKARASKISS